MSDTNNNEINTGTTSVTNAAPVANDDSDIPAILSYSNSDDHNFPAFLRRGKK